MASTQVTPRKSGLAASAMRRRGPTKAPPPGRSTPMVDLPVGSALAASRSQHASTQGSGSLAYVAAQRGAPTTMNATTGINLPRPPTPEHRSSVKSPQSPLMSPPGPRSPENTHAQSSTEYQNAMSLAELLGTSFEPEASPQVKSWPQSWKAVLRQSIERGCPVIMTGIEPPSHVQTDSNEPEPIGQKVHPAIVPRPAALEMPNPLGDDVKDHKVPLIDKPLSPSVQIMAGKSPRETIASAGQGGKAQQDTESKAGKLQVNDSSGKFAPRVENVCSSKSTPASVGAAETAAALGVRVCGVDMGSLLGEQIAMEAATKRVVKAYRLKSHCLTMLPPATLSLFLQLRAPPSMLGRVIDATMIIIGEEPQLKQPYTKDSEDSSLISASDASVISSKPSNANCDPPEPHIPPKYLICSEGMYRKMRDVNVDSITDEQLNRLAPFLTELNYDVVHSVRTFLVPRLSHASTLNTLLTSYVSLPARLRSLYAIRHLVWLRSSGAGSALYLSYAALRLPCSLPKRRQLPLVVTHHRLHLHLRIVDAIESAVACKPMGDTQVSLHSVDNSPGPATARQSQGGRRIQRIFRSRKMRALRSAALYAQEAKLQPATQPRVQARAMSFGLSIRPHLAEDDHLTRRPCSAHFDGLV